MSFFFKLMERGLENAKGNYERELRNAQRYGKPSDDQLEKLNMINENLDKCKQVNRILDNKEWENYHN